MASRAGHCEVAQFLLQNAAQADAKAKVRVFALSVSVATMQYFMRKVM